MAHLCKEFRLSTVSGISRFFLELKNLSFISLLLLLFPHLFDPCGILSFFLVSQDIEQSDQSEDDNADNDIKCDLIRKIRIKLGIAYDDDHIPLIHNGVNKNSVLLTVDIDLKAAVLINHSLLHKPGHTAYIIHIVAFKSFIRVSDDKSVLIEDKTVALISYLKFRHHLLDVVHHKVNGNNVLSVGKLSCDSNYDFTRLGINIRRYDGCLAACINCIKIPITFSWNIIVIRNPVKSVEKLSSDIAVKTCVIIIEVLCLNRSLRKDILSDLLRRLARRYHVINSICSNSQYTLCGLKIVLHLSTDTCELIVTYFVDILDSNTSYDLRRVSNHNYHKAEYDDQRNDQIVVALRLISHIKRLTVPFEGVNRILRHVHAMVILRLVLIVDGKGEHYIFIIPNDIPLDRGEVFAHKIESVDFILTECTVFSHLRCTTELSGLAVNLLKDGSTEIVTFIDGIIIRTVTYPEIVRRRSGVFVARFAVCIVVRSITLSFYFYPAVTYGIGSKIRLAHKILCRFSSLFAVTVTISVRSSGPS